MIGFCFAFFYFFHDWYGNPIVLSKNFPDKTLKITFTRKPLKSIKQIKTPYQLDAMT